MKRTRKVFASSLLRVFLASLLLMLLTANHANAQSCSAVFPDVASSYATAGSISFGVDSRLYDTDGVIDASISADNATRSCDTSACVSSGTQSASLNLTSFNYTNSSVDVLASENGNYYMYQNSYDDMLVQRNSWLSIYQNNTVTRFDYVGLEDNTRLILDGGVYWINRLVTGANVSIEVYGTQKVIIYINSITMGQNVSINVNGSTDQLVLIAYNDFAFSENSKMKGYLYVKEALNFPLNNDFYGAFNAKTISVGQNAKLYTRVADINTARFDGTCTENLTLPDPVHYYPMDMCSVPSGSDSVKDTVSTNHADAEGAIGIDYSSKHCQGLSLSGNQTFVDIPDPAANNNLSQGSISLYFKTPDLRFSSRPSAGYMTLFSRDHNGLEAGGNLTVWVTDSGAVVARHQSRYASYVLSTMSRVVKEDFWHHLVYTWGPAGMRLYLDGNAVAQRASYTGGLSANNRDMVIGASAWQFRASSTASRASQLRDFFKGSIDELRIFDKQLTQSQVLALEQVSSQNCISCSNDPVLVTHWGADVCAFEQNQLIDTESNINGVIRNGISNTYDSRFCQGLSFDGQQSYATVAHDSRLQISNGAISLWFKIPDLRHSNNNRDGGNVLISKDSLGWGNGDHFDVRVDASGKIKVMHQENTSNVFLETASAVVTAGQWHHLVYSFGASGAYVYIDGELKTQRTDFFNGLDTNDETLVFGAGSRAASRGSTSANNFADFLQGELDNIKVYRNQPSSSDISEWYQEQAAQCTTCSTLLAHYTFNETNSDASTIEDSSGNNNDGVFGSSVASALFADNIDCRTAEFPTSNNLSPNNYFDTQILPSEIGNQGAISFWYRANKNWNDGNARQLFDASENVQDKYFFMVKRSNGSIRFALENSRDHDLVLTTGALSFAADTWVHISVQWNLVAKEYSIYINGEAQNLTISDGLSSAELATLPSLVFGAPRSDYLVNGATSNSADGFIDDIRIYSQAISKSQIQTDIGAAQRCEVVDHYLIEHPSSALTCDAPTITLKACANANCSSLSTVQSTLTLTPSQFEPNNTVSFIGQTTVTLRQQSSGTLTIGTLAQEPNAPVSCSNNCEIEFESASMQFFNKVSGETQFNNTWITAETGLDLVGLRIASDNGGTCEGIVDGQQDVELTYACVNTATASYTPSQCNVPFAGIPLSGGASQTGTISLSFDANGEADLSAYSFADAGILRLSASALVNSVTLQAPSTDLNIVPAYLALSSTSAAKITAGVPMPMAFAAYGENDSVLPGYQSNDLEMSVQRLLPSDASAHDSEFYFDANNAVTTALNEAYRDISATFTLGQSQSTTAYFEEVGSYAINIRDSDYLGARISATAITLGRVVPAYFNVEKTHQPILQNACGTSFTYVGESFTYAAGLSPSYTITAYNALGQITQNYAKDLWRLSFDSSTLAAQTSLRDNSTYSEDMLETSALNAIVLSGNEVYDGSAIIMLDGLRYRFPKVIAPTGASASPFSATFDYQLNQAWFTDADGVCYQNGYPSACSGFDITNITGANLRYGRINMENAFGPETEALNIPVFAEYLDDGQWRRNTQDSCTGISMQQSAGGIALTHDQQSPANIAGMLSNLSVNSQLLSGSLPEGTLSAGPFTSGGSNIAGSFFIELVPQSSTEHWSNHLNYDWDGDGDIDSDDKPSASVNLGIYQGNDRTLHWREVLN